MSSKVLIVDDEPDLRLLARLFLEREGFEVSEVTSGAEALALLATETPDVVLLDIRMPDMDGWRVLEELNGAGRLDALNVVMVSASSTDATVRAASEHGCKGFISKPFKPADLLKVVRSAVTA